MEEIWVGARSTSKFPLQLDAGDLVNWEIKPAAFDIQVSISFIPTQLEEDNDEAEEENQKKDKKKEKTVNEIIVLKNTKINFDSPLVDAYTAKEPGVLTFNFDNGYSKLRGKTILLKVSSASSSLANSLPFGITKLTTYGPATIEGRRKEDGIYIVALPYGKAYLNHATLSQAPDDPRGAKTTNERCLVGVHMFFNNRVWEAEDFFRPEVNKFPMFSLAYASIGFLRAMMTWEKDDLAEANLRLKKTKHFVEAFLPKESTMTSVGRFFTGSTGPSLTPMEMEASLISAETSLLISNMLLTEESVMSFIKAGLKIRSGWKLYEKCHKQVSSESNNNESPNVIDPSVFGGIEFGIGSFNTIISILPPIILKVIAVLGFPCDREKGMSLLHSCFNRGGIRSPLSSLIICMIHVVVPSIFSVFTETHAREGALVIEKAFKTFPNGALFLWMNGRLKRMVRDEQAAVDNFLAAAKAQPDWQQLQHLMAYELGWCYQFQHRLDMAILQWQKMEKENNWSKAFFAYMVAVLTLDLPDKSLSSSESSSASTAQTLARLANNDNAARPYFELVSNHAGQRKFGGKILAIETFVNRRATEFLKNGKRPALPSLEMAYIFYAFNQMNPAELQECYVQLENRAKCESGGYQSLNKEELTLLDLVKGAVLIGMRRYDEAEKLLRGVAAVPVGDLKADTYIHPFSRFELASSYMEQVVYGDERIKGASSSDKSEWTNKRASLCNLAKVELKAASAFKSAFDFKNRLHFRIHLANVELRQLVHEKPTTTAGEGEDVNED